MGWFKSGKNEVWREFSDEIGATFEMKGKFSGGKVSKPVGPWTLTLDAYTVSSGETHVTYTRVRVPYVNPDGFRFKLYRAGPFSGVGRWLGMQDIEVGDPAFDDAVVLKSHDESRARELFADPKARALVLAQPKIRLEVKDNEGWFGATYPEGVDALQFLAVGVIKDRARLKDLFDLFPALLERLCRIGSATRQAPGVAL